MKQEGLSYFTDTGMVSVGLLIFLAWFVGMLVWVHRKEAKRQYEAISLFPLRDGGDL
jgi:cbb3-type cytochrome oxidase subunit 3